MKILVISHEFPPIGGGGANACYYLTQEFAKNGHDVTVITAKYNTQSLSEQLNGVNLVRVKCKRTYKEHCSFVEMLSFIVKAWPVAKFLQAKHKFDICHIFFGIPSGPIGYLLKKKYKIPYVIRFGGGDIPGFQDRFKQVYILLSPFIKKIWSNANALVANSIGLKKLATDFYDRKTVEIIPNGIDTSVYFPKPDENKDIINILFVSRLIERKGLQYIIPQLNYIQKNCSYNIRLTVVGNGPYRETLEILAKKNHCSNLISFEGQKEKTEIVSYYQDADLFILPSAKEGMPNVVLEAMACGLPIVMTPCQGSDELISENGIISTIDNFVDNIITLCNDKNKRILMGKKSLEMCINKFGWNRQAEEYLKLFENIVKNC